MQAGRRALPYCGCIGEWSRVTRVKFAINGRYVFFDTDYSNIGPRHSATLIDDQTGKRTSLPGCTDPLVGGPWLSLDCANTGAGGLPLYQLATGDWRTVNLFCNSGQPAYIYTCRPTGLGANWIAVTYGPTCYEHYCPGTGAAQSIWTAQSTGLPPTPPGGGQVIDLNSPTLVRTVCRPLRVPASTEPYESQQGPGSLTFYGPFAVTSGNLPDGIPYAYLARCRSRLHVPLPPGRIPIDGTATSSYGRSCIGVWAEECSRAFDPCGSHFLPTSFTCTASSLA